MRDREVDKSIDIKIIRWIVLEICKSRERVCVIGRGSDRKIEGYKNRERVK